MKLWSAKNPRSTLRLGGIGGLAALTYFVTSRIFCIGGKSVKQLLLLMCNFSFRFPILGSWVLSPLARSLRSAVHFPRRPDGPCCPCCPCCSTPPPCLAVGWPAPLLGRLGRVESKWKRRAKRQLGQALAKLAFTSSENGSLNDIHPSSVEAMSFWIARAGRAISASY